MGTETTQAKQVESTLILAVPSETRVGAGKVTVKMPDGSTIQAEVFAVSFDAPDQFWQRVTVAPELLEALRMQQGACCGTVDKPPCQFCRKSLAVLAKATGQEG